MDADLRAMIHEAGGIVEVCRITALSSGGKETLGEVIEIPALVEHKRESWPNAVAGGAAAGTSRKTRTEITIAKEDVDDLLGGVELTEEYRFWADGTSVSPKFSKRPDRFYKARDPETGQLSHYEVTL